MDRWVGKCAVVTGASTGIGAATALALANAGMTVVAAARRMEKLQELQKKVKGQGRVVPCRCDVTQENEIVALMEFAKKNGGGVDVLVNNAAVLATGSITGSDGQGTSLKLIEESLKTNLMAVITSTRIATADMIKRKTPGHVIVINSIAGHKILNLGSVPGVSIYPPTKHAITALQEIIRLEYSYTNSPIRCTSISPGAVNTALLHKVPELTKNIPQLQPEDVAEAILYVLSVPQAINISELTIEATGEKM